LGAQYHPIDLPGMEAKAQDSRAMDFKLKNAPLASELERMKLTDDMGRQSALESYRGVAKASDPYSALETLDAYPELQSQLEGAMGGMDPETRRAASTRARVFGEAAKFVMGFPDGSEEQKQAWTNSLQVLLEDGHIDQNTYDLALKSGPNRMLLTQAVETQKLMERYTDPRAVNDTRLTDARIEDIGTDNERASGEAENRNTNRTSRATSLNEQGDARVGIMRDRETNKVTKINPTKASGGGETRRDRVLKRVDSIAESKGIEYGTPEYDELKARVFKEQGLTDDPVAPDAATANANAGVPEGTTETKSVGGKTYHKINGKWFAVE
jgi:hypothetical protein